MFGIVETVTRDKKNGLNDRSTIIPYSALLLTP